MSTPSPVISRTEPLPDGILVVLAGEIDLSVSPALRAALLELSQKQPRRMVLDMTGVPYSDSSGIAVLVEMLQLQRRQQGKLVLCGLQPKVKSIFEIARLTTIFTITDNVDAGKTV